MQRCSLVFWNPFKVCTHAQVGQRVEKTIRRRRNHLVMISSLLHSINLILFTLLLIHPILHISTHHSHHDIHSHYLSLPRPFTPDVMQNSSLSQILSSIVFVFLHHCLHGFWTLTELSEHWFCLFLAMCARLSWLDTELFSPCFNSSIVSYHMRDPTLSTEFQTSA